MLRTLLGKLIEWLLSYKHKVRVQVLSVFAKLPRVGFKDDAGFDLYSTKPITIQPKQVVDVACGIAFDCRSRVWFEIKARSSTFRKLGLEVQDAIIDRGYRGEMSAIVYNPSDKEVSVSCGDRICQIVPHHLVPCKFEFGELSRSDRGRRGFGSTGRGL